MTPKAQPFYTSLEHADSKHKKIFVVDWCLSSVCNYACSYCPENLHDHKFPFPDLDAALHFASLVREQFPEREIFFQFTGGEVALWKDLPALLKGLKAMDCKVGIISNGSRSLEWWQKNAELLDHVCISFHSEFAKLDHFLDVVKFLAPRTTVHANVMMSPQNFDLCLEAGRQLSAIVDVTVALQPLIIEFKDTLYDYTAEQLEAIHFPQRFLTPAKLTRNRFNYRGLMRLRNQEQDLETLPSHELIGRGWNRWQNWECSAGVEQLVVDFVGDIYRGWCTEGGKIANIQDEKIQLPTQPIRCVRGYCHCNLDIMTTKVKPVSLGLSTQI